MARTKKATKKAPKKTKTKKSLIILGILSFLITLSVTGFLLYTKYDNPVQQIFRGNELQLTEYDGSAPQIEQSQRVEPQVKEYYEEPAQENRISINFGQITTGLMSILSILGLIVNITGIQLKDLLKKKKA